MDTKAALTALAVIVVLGVGGYFGWQALDRNSTTTDTQPYGTQENNSPEENKPVEETPTPAPTPAPAEPAATAPKSTVIKMETSEGVITIQLDGEAAPLTTANFVKLANQGFYNGLTFHRIIAGFMIQGGDPDGTGSGGPGYTVPAEIKLKHDRGTIATARTGDAVNPAKASSGSQFFINLVDNDFLNGEYTAFGKVTAGMDIVDKIAATPTGAGDYPTKEVKINKVTVEKSQ